MFIMLSFKKLWAVQLAEYPESVRLSPYQLLMWAQSATTDRAKMRRLASIASTTQHRRVLFYLTNPESGYIGARFGLDGCEYHSGFNDYRVKLSGDTLVDTNDF
jgi:hypothetical protein